MSAALRALVEASEALRETCRDLRVALAREQAGSAVVRERTQEAVAYARERIAICRRQERKFSDLSWAGRRARRHMSSIPNEAATERRALQTMLRILGESEAAG